MTSISHLCKTAFILLNVRRLCSALLPFVVSRSSNRPSLSLALPLLMLLCPYRLTSSLITALPFWHRELTWDVGLERVCIIACVRAHVCKSRLFKHTVSVWKGWVRLIVQFALRRPIVLKTHHEFNWWPPFSLVCWQQEVWAVYRDLDDFFPWLFLVQSQTLIFLGFAVWETEKERDLAIFSSWGKTINSISRIKLRTDACFKFYGVYLKFTLVSGFALYSVLKGSKAPLGSW